MNWLLSKFRLLQVSDGDSIRSSLKACVTGIAVIITLVSLTCIFAKLYL